MMKETGVNPAIKLQLLSNINDSNIFFHYCPRKIAKKRKMTKEELVLKCGTNKSYVKRIENDSSDIRLSMLMRIVKVGLGGKLKLSLEL